MWRGSRAGRHVERGAELRVAAGEVEDRLVALDRQRQRQPAGIAVDAVLVGIVREEVLAIRHRAQDVARLMLGIVHQPVEPVHEALSAEFLHHRLDLALAGVERAGQRLEVAHVQMRLADIHRHDPQDLLVEDPVAHQGHRREADALLMDLGQRARQARRHRAAHVGVVDMAADEADDLALVEDRLPEMGVGRVRREIAAIGIVGEGDVARPIVVDQLDRPVVVHARIPGRAEIHRHGDDRGPSGPSPSR